MHTAATSRPHTLRRTLLAVAVSGAGALALLASPAGAATVLSESLGAGGERADACSAGIGGSGSATRSFTVPASGFLRATLTGGRGDWDLVVFSDRSGDPVAGGASPGPDEVASGFALEGERLTAQACRREGAGGSPTLSVDVTEVTADKPAPPPSLVRVSTPTDGDRKALEASGLDLSEAAGPRWRDVVAYGRRDLDRLARLGLPYSVRSENLIRESRADRRAELRAAEASGPQLRAAGDGFPSGRAGTYRRLFEYEEELKALAERYPNRVRLFTLPEKTYEGRTISGIEITRNAGVRNGKPIFLQMGLHHAREWPSGEHAIEWAYEILNGARDGEKRAARLLRKVRTVVIPVVNPDGFNASREAGELQGAAGGRTADDDTAETVNIITHPIEYRRKNCRYLDDSEGGNCMQPDVGLAAAGVDPNRNYGGLWGGPGASSDPTAADYRGPGPFSEPETRNIQSYFSKRQVTLFLSNHTYTGLWLRPPSLASQGDPIDHKVFKRLGRRSTNENGYANIPGYQLYDTSGGTEDWAYNATGALGYTPEIGAKGFHPAFDITVAEWTGDSADFEAQGGNREAYYKNAEFAAAKRSHALIKGKGPRRGKIILKKRFITETSPVLDADGGTPGEILTFRDRLRTVARIRKRGRFKYHLNPSTRPIVAVERGVENPGPPSDAEQFAGDAGTTTPCADFETEDPSCWNDHPLVIPDEPGRDNAQAVVRIEWASEGSDWDMKIFRDSNGDGSSVGETEEVGNSGNGPSNFEQATIGAIEPGEKYVIRVQNYAALEPYEGTVSYLGPEPFQPAERERWKLVVKNRKGKVVKRRKLYIERGQVKKLNLKRRGRGKKK